MTQIDKYIEITYTRVYHIQITTIRTQQERTKSNTSRAQQIETNVHGSPNPWVMSTKTIASYHIIAKRVTIRDLHITILYFCPSDKLSCREYFLSYITKHYIYHHLYFL